MKKRKILVTAGGHPYCLLGGYRAAIGGQVEGTEGAQSKGQRAQSRKNAYAHIGNEEAKIARGERRQIARELPKGEGEVPEDSEHSYAAPMTKKRRKDPRRGRSVQRWPGLRRESS